MLEKLRSGIIFDKSPIKVLLFSNRSISILQKFIQNSPSKNEAGGIIIGEVKGQHIYITDVTYPRKNDIQKRIYFGRRDNYHVLFYKKEYHKNPCIKYFGELHTHPEQKPTPSLTDKNEWDKICMKIRDPNIFLIIGTHNIYIEIRWHKKISLYTL